MPGRRYGDFVELLEPFHAAQCVSAKDEVLGEAVWNKLRLVIAHDPQVALDAGVTRDKRIDDLKKQADQWVGKLQDQDEGKKSGAASSLMAGHEPSFTQKCLKPI